MIRYKLAAMIEKKQFADGRNIPITEVATDTGLNRMTLSKILNQRGYCTTTDTIDRLCAYFGCEVHDLMERVADE